VRGAAAAELLRFVLAPAALEPANGVMQHPQRRPENGRDRRRRACFGATRVCHAMAHGVTPNTVWPLVSHSAERRHACDSPWHGGVTSSRQTVAVVC
jgi:hypothetical protein